MTRPAIIRGLTANRRSGPPGHVAAADCERVRPGFLAQPVNAITSLAATLAGGAVWLAVVRAPRSASRPGRARRGALLVAATAIAANGPGGLAYHGPGGPVGHRLHDGALVATIGSVLLVDAGDLLRGGPADLRRAVGPFVVMCVGALVHVRSRTGCSWCRPDSRFQGHAVWHLLSAGALGWWGVRAARSVPGVGPR